jgi:hypothetical protein
LIRLCVYNIVQYATADNLIVQVKVRNARLTTAAVLEVEIFNDVLNGILVCFQEMQLITGAEQFKNNGRFPITPDAMQ